MAESKGYVVTLDDITDLLSAQRTGAWADVARRIAHEIKNPLTPIQLAPSACAGATPASSPTISRSSTNRINTILRQVGDIGRMVDEFSSFARMPEAKPDHGRPHRDGALGGVPRKRAAARCRDQDGPAGDSRSRPGSTSG